MFQNDAIYLVSEHLSDHGRHRSQEYHILATFLREQAQTLTTYEELKTALAQRLGTTVEIWAMHGMTYSGVEMMLGTTALSFAIPEWRRVYRLVALPTGGTEIPEGAELITHWRPLPGASHQHARQELAGARYEG